MEKSKLKITQEIELERQLLLKQFLKNAPFDQWSRACLIKSAKQVGYLPGYDELLFPAGIQGLTQYYHDYIDMKMTQEFSNLEINKVTEKIIKLLEIRFALYGPSKEAINALVKYKLKPENILTSKSLLWSTCSKIWYLAGDASTDYNYYSKRSLLALVYSSSMIYWLNDASENHQKTSLFIRNRIDNVLALGKLKQRAVAFFQKLC